MKNTRTQRNSDELKNESPKSYWMGACKYWKDYQLKTSHGNYGSKTK